MRKSSEYKEWEGWRRKAKSLYWFCTVVLAESFPDKFHDFGKLQKEMCDFLDLRQTPSRRKFLSAFRGSLKTTVLLGYTVWLFCWYLASGKFTSIIYDTATKANCQNFNDDFRYCLVWSENELLHYIFPELPRREEDYRSFTKSKVKHQHVNIDFASTEETLVSRHHPIWINDDLEHDKNIKHKTGRKSLKDSWRYQKAILTKSKKRGIGLEIDTGTPFHFDGLIWMIKNLPSYDKFEAPCFTYNGEYCYQYKEGVESSWPEYYGVEDFLEKREDMGSHIWSSQYLLKPLSEQDVLCKEEWVQHWKYLPDVSWRTMVIDAGGMDPEQDDATGITVIDTDPKGDMYEVHTEEFWGTSIELMQRITWLQKTHKPDDTRIEKDKYAITIADQLQHKAPLMGISFVEHKGRPKGYKRGEIQWQGRIWRMQYWFEKGRFYFNPDNRLLSDRVQMYPYGERDDIEDSLAYHLDIRRIPPPYKKPRFELVIEKNFDDEYEKYINSRTGSEDYKFYDKIF